MSGQRSSNSEGTAESVAAGCSLREGPPRHPHFAAAASTTATRHSPSLVRRDHVDGLALFMWGRGEDGQLGLGDTSDQDEPTYVRSNTCILISRCMARLRCYSYSLFSSTTG